jgi:hypothetical protein
MLAASANEAGALATAAANRTGIAAANFGMKTSLAGKLVQEGYAP